MEEEIKAKQEIDKEMNDNKVNYTQHIANKLRVSDNNWSEVNIEDIVRTIYDIQGENCWQDNDSLYILLNGKRIVNCRRNISKTDIDIKLDIEK